MTSTSPTRRAAARLGGCMALAVTALLAAACAGDGTDTIDSAGASETTPGDTTAEDPGLSAAARELLEDYGLGEADCTEEVDSTTGLVAKLSCDHSPVAYVVARYDDVESQRTVFRGITDQYDVDTRRWWYDDDPDAVMGQMIAVADGTTAHIFWTNEDTLVVGHASRSGADNLAALEEWWGSDGSVAEDDSPAAAFAPGDCVDLPASGAGGEPQVVGCGDAAAEAEVLEVVTGTTEPDCGSDSDRTYGVETTDAGGTTEAYALCLATLVDPADTDGVLAVGSCVQAVPTGPDTHDVTEHACSDPLVTHEVTASVADSAPCPANEPLWFDKTDEEVTASGPGDWCLALH
jgi:hypothetical protein